MITKAGNIHFDSASQTKMNRFSWVFTVWQLLSEQLGRPARILHMQCGDGSLLIELAKHGAPAVGIDSRADCIRVCTTRAEQSNLPHLRFVHATIEELFETGDLRNIDCVIGFEVIDEIVRTHGVTQAHQWLAKVADQVSACLLNIEDLQHSSVVYQGFSFAHAVAFSPKNKTAAAEYFFYASNQFWLADGTMTPFTHATRTSRPANQEQFSGTRSYLRNKTTIAKFFQLRGYERDENRKELTREVSFLSAPPAGFAPIPKIVTQGVNEHEAWIVRERLPGDLLCECIRRQKPFDEQRVIKSILTQLAALESAGLYHNDLRTWNVLLQPDQSATLIDYGSISHEPKNLIWPVTPFAAFWLFVWCVTVRSTWNGEIYAPAFMSPVNLPDPYRAWGLATFDHAPETWRFSALLATFDEAMLNTTPPVLTSQQLWMMESEQYMNQLNRSIYRLYAAVSTFSDEVGESCF